ncbi:DPP IV N-terminal domain-containing protein [Luteimonas mephitis]|uniref:S9 family peptidase n=1 Tax=Luteimonas mephitis TaxID=83615 RepID=UPI003A956150
MAVAGCLAAGLALATAASAQAPAVTADDYARAEKFLPHNTAPLVDHVPAMLDWIDDDQFVYRDHDAGGDRFLRVDAVHGGVVPAFDHVELARALGEAAGKPVKAENLPLKRWSIEDDGRIALSAFGKEWRCDLSGHGECMEKTGEPGVASPDGTQEAFIRDWNLWVRELSTGTETQLTTDGTTDYGYATDNAGWKHTDKAILVWSPDSTKIATFHQDQRRTSEMVLVHTNVGAPKVERWKYPFVGDEHVTMIERVVIDVPAREVVRLKMPPDQHRSTLCDDVSCSGGWEDVQWAPDGRTLAFASTSRDHQQTWLRVADVETGEVRTVFDEKVDTYFESGNGAVNWRYLPRSNEILWFSERDNWGNLYLYDATSGKLKHAVTSGAGNVTEVLRVDPETRAVWFRGVGMEDGRNPYYQHFYKVSLDGGEPVLLTPEGADHKVELSPGGTYFIDTYSTTDTAPVTVLRSAADGALVREVARGDISRLRAAGWVAPEPFTVKARDGRTDLYGLMFKPTNFDPSKQYPIINYVYPGPQTGSVRSRSFRASHGDNQALAELGFIVVAIDGMGTPWRSKAFHDAYFGNIGDNTLPDQVTGMRQLARRFPWIDLDRAGIWGHSGGGNATAGAMFRYPDFFKVGIAESGNHDNRSYEDDWAEKWQGLPVIAKDGSSNYDDQANQNHAGKLAGHLLLIHGMLDDNVPPANTLLVVQALVEANKDFDLLLLPEARHGYGSGEVGMYVTRKRWDYFVRHLLGTQPPAGYRISPARE